MRQEFPIFNGRGSASISGHFTLCAGVMPPMRHRPANGPQGIWILCLVLAIAF